MSYLFIILIVAVGGGLWFLSSRSSGNKTRSTSAVARSRKSTPAASSASQWHAVIIRFDAEACAAARALENTRFLSREAPTTPLPDCDAETCNCKYVHYNDRRKEDSDRRSMASLRSSLHEASGDEEKRGKRGRRSSDQE